MARIDSLIKHLYEFSGDALGIGSGHQVMLVSHGERRPITASAVPESQVEMILGEIVPPGELGKISQPGEHNFSYRAPAGPVGVRVTRDPSGLKLIVTRSGGGDAPPPPAMVQERSGEASSEEFAMPKTGVTQIPPEIQAQSASSSTPKHDTPKFEVPKSAAEISEAPPPPNLTVTRVQQAVKRVASQEPTWSITDDDGNVRADIPEPSGVPTSLDNLLRQMVERRGSDLYVCTSKPPIIRRDGDLVALGDSHALSEEETTQLIYAITPQSERQKFVADNDVDFAYDLEGVARFRVNVFRDRMGISSIMRQIPSKILSSDDLNLPKSVLDFCHLNKGLVVVTGPTGSGKSTTLAAMIDYINRTQSVHIITIEDPIEFVHQDKRAVMNQREIGNHTKGFKRALRAALREDPDIVLVGEMRDLETVEIAIETAETGHLVFGTLHTNTAHSTVDRIIDQFSSDRQSQVRTMLSEALRGVVAQTLCKKKGGGRIAALEIMVVTPSVSNIIREGKTFQLPSVMQTGKSVGMVTLNDSLMTLVKDGVVEPKEAWTRAVDKNDFKNQLARNNMSID